MSETIAADASAAPESMPAPRLPPPADAPVDPPPPAPVEHPFEFRGAEREYFRIWIVNLALTIVTLGIWSAWAKVRTERYFYASTRVAGTPFEYTARPLPILRGRIIAFTLFGSYLLASQFSLKLQIALIAVIALVSPWLIVRGLMFRARYSSWRGLAFRFEPNYREAYTTFLFIYALFPFTLGFIFPYVKWRQKKFFVEHHRFGGRAFSYAVTSGDFYVVYMIALGIVIAAWFGLVTVMFSAVMASAGMRAGSMTTIYTLTALMYLIYFIVFVYLAARVINLTYNNAVLDGFRLRSTVRARDLAKLYLLNTLAILLSAGMLVPWAMIRMARYRASRLVLVASGDLEGLATESEGQVSAVGAEMDHVFDLDIGL